MMHLFTKKSAPVQCCTCMGRSGLEQEKNVKVSHSGKNNMPNQGKITYIAYNIKHDIKQTDKGTAIYGLLILTRQAIRA